MSKRMENIEARNEEIIAKQIARERRLDIEATPGHAAAETKWSVDSRATDSTMCLNPWTGRHMPYAAFVVDRETRRATGDYDLPPLQQLEITYIGQPQVGGTVHELGMVASSGSASQAQTPVRSVA